MRPTTEEQVQKYLFDNAKSELLSSGDQIEYHCFLICAVIACGALVDYYLCIFALQLLQMMQRIPLT